MTKYDYIADTFATQLETIPGLAVVRSGMANQEPKRPFVRIYDVGDRKEQYSQDALKAVSAMIALEVCIDRPTTGLNAERNRIAEQIEHVFERFEIPFYDGDAYECQFESVDCVSVSGLYDDDSNTGTFGMNYTITYLQTPKEV